MKEIFDWLRERIKEESATGFVTKGAGFRYLPTVTAESIITEAEAKWKEKEAELRANVIDEFAEKIEFGISESIIWDMLIITSKNASVSDASDKIVDYVIETVKEIASNLKGEKECQE